MLTSKVATASTSAFRERVPSLALERGTYPPRSRTLLAAVGILKSAFLAVGFTVMLGLIPCADASTTRYAITDIGLLPGAIFSEAVAINNLGQVAGNAYLVPNPAAGVFSDGLRPFVWSSGALTPLALPQGATYAQATGINNSGDMVGASNGSGVLWRGNAVQVLNSVPGAEHLVGASGINAFGEIVGTSVQVVSTGPGTSTSRTFATLISGATAVELPGLSGAGSTFALAINDAGMVAGLSGNGVVWRNGVPGELPAGTFGIGSAAEAINASGDAAGAILLAGGDFLQAAIWQSGVPSLIELSTGYLSSRAIGINDSGHAVGFLRTSNETFRLADALPGDRAFLWEGGVLQDLNALIPGDAGWILQRAADINELGQIVGTGIAPDGRMHGFVLTPVPEPSQLVLMLAGLITLGMMSRRKKQSRQTGFPA